LSVLWDRAAGHIFVTRGILSHVWEGYDSGNNVFLSREAIRWVRELIADISLAEFADTEVLRDELAGQLFLAVVGTSRLPLTSIEAPLPGFTLGQFGYFYGGPTDAMSWRERAKWLEFKLRGGNVAELLAYYASAGMADDLPALLRTMFNEVSLSPYTDFVDNTLSFTREIVRLGHLTPVAEIDFLGHLLRQLGRHLSAYDLITFHHRGANYPDALLLDAVLREYAARIDACPELFLGTDNPARLRRRALRQALLLRRYYEGHLVPDAPTSPGENARVLPEPYRRVPEEQLTEPTQRVRQLFADLPLAVLLSETTRRVFCESISDLSHPVEARELGVAVFIDRPFGFAKLPGEPDQTPLLAHEAFSRSIARRRLLDLRQICTSLDIHVHEDHWAAVQNGLDAPVASLPVRDTWTPERPVVSLADAKRVADDFVLLRTLPGSMRQLLTISQSMRHLQARSASEEDIRTSLALRAPKTHVALNALIDLSSLHEEKGLIVLVRAGVLAVFDGDMHQVLELEVDPRGGYRQRGGVELPRSITVRATSNR